MQHHRRGGKKIVHFTFNKLIQILYMPKQYPDIGYAIEQNFKHLQTSAGIRALIKTNQSKLK